MPGYKLRVYFAHPHFFRNAPEVKKIIEILKSRRVEVINPFDGEDDLMLTKYNRKNYYPDPPRELGISIWKQDLRRVNECDMIVIYVPEGERLSGGCSWELNEAYRLNKFIQIISSNRHPIFAYVLEGKGRISKNQMFETIDDFARLREIEWK